MNWFSKKPFIKPKRFKIEYDIPTKGYTLYEFRDSKYVKVGNYSDESKALEVLEKIKHFPKEFD